MQNRVNSWGYFKFLYSFIFAIYKYKHFLIQDIITGGWGASSRYAIQGRVYCIQTSSRKRMSVESSLLFFCMRIHILKCESSENQSQREERCCLTPERKSPGHCLSVQLQQNSHYQPIEKCHLISQQLSSLYCQCLRELSVFPQICIQVPSGYTMLKY